MASVSAQQPEATKPTPEQLEFFEKNIRPLFVTHCHKCHSRTSKPNKGGLLLDHGDGLRKGGDSGPAVVPGKPAESLLVQSVKYLDYEAGVYQVDAFRGTPVAAAPKVTIDDSKLGDSLIGTWSLDGDTRRLPLEKPPAKVAGKLVGDKAVVGHVLVESPDDPVTVFPDVRLQLVALVTAGFGETDQVKPVARPTLTVMP